MSSLVYYKFRSQKEPSRITFDGTGITVFDLKREILQANKLDTSADSFDLRLSNPDTKEEYTDDTEVIPRSMSVIARRTPVSRGGRDSAAKYINGAGPTLSLGKNAGRREDGKKVGPGGLPSGNSSGPGAVTSLGAAASAGSEEDRISAMFAAQGEQWKNTQEHMAGAAPVYYNNKAAANVPDHPPPTGYLCHRCGKKGHWIQACPTNQDPTWEVKRVRRTTGIPRSMLRTVQKPAEDDEQGGNYLVNEDGEYVVAVADDKSWEKFQTKRKQLHDLASVPDDPELVDPLSNKLFADPVKTPCCKKTYSKETIQQALLDSDFVCPNCKTEEVLLDQLVPDEEMEAKIKEYREKHGLVEEDDGEEYKKAKNDSGPIDDNVDISKMPFIPPFMMPGMPPFMPPPPPFFMMPPAGGAPVSTPNSAGNPPSTTEEPVSVATNGNH